MPGGSGRVASVAVPGGSVEWLLWRCVDGVGGVFFEAVLVALVEWLL